MKNYLISYDLHSPNRNYSPLIEKIQTAPYWSKVNESAWFVKSSLTTVELKNILEQTIDVDDVLFVAEMNSCAWTKSLKQEVQEHIFNCWNL